MAKKQEIPNLRPAPDYGELHSDYIAGLVKCPRCSATQTYIPEKRLQPVKCNGCNAKFFQPSALGDYMLYGFCGAGGMGAVYKAVSAKFPGRELAVKVLSREGRENPNNIQALMNEARIASRFADSDFLAGCLDSGYVGGEYFTVMPLVEGEGLDKMIKRLKRIPEREMLQIALHILAAEQHIYRKGFLFRDLKPENVMVNYFGYATLLDFGLCITTEEAANPNKEEFVTGSPYYMPPERLLGNPESRASEIYSLGMVIFCGLTGQTYYEADELDKLVKRHVSNLRINRTVKMEGIREPVARIIDKMIQQEPEKRYQTFEEVAESIYLVME